MSLEIDLSRAPLGQLAAMKLVEAVAASDDRVERHYLEVKSDLDLTKKKDLAKIAKYILGSANRLPDVAARAFDGYGVMVIGVAPGEIRGVPPIEVLEINKTVSQYLGASGPQWDVVRVPVKDSANEVLVVVIDPPQAGQKPFPCRKEGDGLMDGRVYIRADGETREAKADEFDRLLDRAAASSAPGVSFEVDVVGHAYPLQVDEQVTLEPYIGRVTEGLLGSLPGPKRKPAQRDDELITPAKVLAEMRDGRAGVASEAIADMGAGLFDVTPESRTEDEYRESITQWEQDLRARWLEAVDVLGGHSLEWVTFRVRNTSRTFLHDVEAKFHLDGDVRGIDLLGDDGEEVSVSDLDFPDPPRAWGPIRRSKYGLVAPRHIVPSPYIPPATHQSRLSWKNSGSIDLKLEVGDLRPYDEYVSDEPEIILVVPATQNTPVRGRWEITARGHNDIYSGDLVVEVGSVVDLTSDLQALLDLD